MATIAPSRQPFAALDSPRLQYLASAKNRQNAITASLTSEKSTLSPLSPPKKRRCPSPFEDDLDSENVDPSIFNSPSKRSKCFDGTPQKAPKFSLNVNSSAKSVSSHYTSPRSLASPRKAVSSPTTSTTTPINHSRGSPKHKRIGLLSRRKTSGGSPFTRVDPPSFGRNSTSSLPFSLDAALSGSIPSYAPKPVVENKVPTLEESMPNSWFFEIHEDTPEEEATNLMEHSACVLDISSDDDCETRFQNEARERGKENIPPPDFLASLGNSNNSQREATDSTANTEVAPQPVKMSAREKFAAMDAMVEDRNPLSALRTADYYGPGLDAASYVVIDGTAPTKPSGLSKECKGFDFNAPIAKQEEAPVEEKNEQLPIWEEEVHAETTIIQEVAENHIPTENISSIVVEEVSVVIEETSVVTKETTVVIEDASVPVITVEPASQPEQDVVMA